MMRSFPLVFLLALPAIAGCLSDDAPTSGAVDAEPVRAGSTAELASADAAAPLALLLTAPGDRIELSGVCPCDGVTIDVDGAGLWEKATGWLEVRLLWDGTESAAFNATLTTSNGTVFGDTRGFDSLRVLAWKPDGTYDLEITGSGPVSGWVALREKGARQSVGNDLIPNLQTLVPTDIAIGQCQPAETVEQQATRCLRLSNGVANTGDGPLEVRLSYPEGALSAAGLGTFLQRLYGVEGDYRHVEVGPAEFHAVHGHFHYDGLAHFVLYSWDEATGTRGPEVNVGHKAGFCFLDWAPMHEPEFDPEYEGAHAEQDCLLPTQEGWAMGISPGWYDLYWAELADQYVDIAGVPDGTYELVSLADAPQTLIETDETDNAASAVIRLVGESVTVLDERGFYTRAAGDL